MKIPPLPKVKQSKPTKTAKFVRTVAGKPTAFSNFQDILEWDHPGSGFSNNPANNNCLAEVTTLGAAGGCARSEMPDCVAGARAARAWEKVSGIKYSGGQFEAVIRAWENIGAKLGL